MSDCGLIWRGVLVAIDERIEQEAGGENGDEGHVVGGAGRTPTRELGPKRADGSRVEDPRRRTVSGDKIAST